MNATKKSLKGSELRDSFKKWHKTLSGSFYASDIDFVLVTKSPPKICAALDYKQHGENVTFSEVIAYNHLIELGIPIYLITTDPASPDVNFCYKTITIRQYTGGDWKPDPPTIKTTIIKNNITTSEYGEWERSIRRKLKHARIEIPAEISVRKTGGRSDIPMV